ncbi:hypothetical protein ACIQTZ_07465 [Paenarthrobacter sp. NPDC090520]|uniref:hypothetical protein n=1 Tax=Paenarthrobacter sp. NPDC090520 TaxID=3364382 RepID=UPI00382F7453
MDTGVSGPSTGIGSTGVTAGLSANQSGGVEVAMSGTQGAMAAGAAATVGSSAALASTGLNQSFLLWAVGLVLLGLVLAASSRRKAAATRR